MGKYLDMLKAAETQGEMSSYENHLPSDPPKLPESSEPGSGSFGGWVSGMILGIEGGEDGAALEYPTCDGAPYFPYAAPLSPEAVTAIRSELVDLIETLAEYEDWPDAHRARLLGLVARQPISTLADDLAYFRRRIDAARTAKHAAKAAGRARCPSK